MANLPPSPEEPNEPQENILRRLPCNYWPAKLRVKDAPLRHTQHAPELTGKPLWILNDLLELQRDPMGSLVVLHGLRGTGKTQIAICAAQAFKMPLCKDNDRRRCEDEKTPMYTKTSDIFREIRGTYRKESTQSEIDVLNTFTRPRLLIIDEAQERGETEFEDRSLTHIIDKRYDSMLHTVIISNLKPEELAKSLGASIVSRLHETGKAIECDWPSFREKK